MMAGDWARAWAVSDAVLRGGDRTRRDDPGLPYHLRWVWDGQPLDGRDVLVRCYHGLGDTLQFCRFLPVLRQRAARVTLEVQPALAGLLAGMADAVVPFDVAAPVRAAECDVEVMELFHALRLGVGRAGILAGPDPPGEHGRCRAIGVCWAAGAWDAGRSVPLAHLLRALPGGLVSLQRGAAAGEARSGRFLNPGDDDRDVARTAALIRRVRLVVTVDTMVAHLAGALGRPAIVLLRHDADWRWMRGARSAWYPSLRLLRQAAPGDWSAPLEALSRAAG